MKALNSAVTALIFSGFSLGSAFAHPPAYGPEGLIPHSHTISGTVVSGTSMNSFGDPCPKVDHTALAGAQPMGFCIRVNHGRPVDHHVITSPNVHTTPIIMQRPILQPVIRPVRFVQPVPVVRPIVRPIVRTVVLPPRPVMPVRLALPQNLPPQMVTQFMHEGTLLTVTNTQTRGLFGLTLIEITDPSGKTVGSWWTSEGQCFSGQAFLAQACWSRTGYQARFMRALKEKTMSGTTNLTGYNQRSEDPCDHYSALEAKISEDTSGFCGY